MDVRNVVSRVAVGAGSAVGTVLDLFLSRTMRKVSNADFWRAVVAAAIEPPSRDLLERAFRKHFDPIYHADGGDLLAVYESREPGLGAFRVLASQEGDHGAYFALRILTDRTWEDRQRPRLLEECDEWTREYRFPRVHTYRRLDGSVAIAAEGYLFVGDSGVHQALVEDFIGATVGGTIQFWAHLLGTPLGETGLSLRRAANGLQDPLHSSTPRLTDEDLRRLLEEPHQD